MRPQTESESLQPEREWRSTFERTGTNIFAGYVYDATRLDQTFSVEILLDGIPIEAVLARDFVSELADKDVSDGRYGFSIALDEDVLKQTSVVEARLANLGISVGRPTRLLNEDATPVSVDAAGSVQWMGGLRFAGWVAGESDFVVAEAYVGGELIARVRADGWVHIGLGDNDARIARAFDFGLPDRFADGRVHRLSMVDSKGAKLLGSPLPFVAFADGLAKAIAALADLDSERFRGELFDRLVPQSMPFSSYENWRRRFPVVDTGVVSVSCAVLMVGPGDCDATLESLAKQRHAGWLAAALPSLSEQARFEPDAALEFLTEEGADCQVVVFCLAGVVFGDLSLDRIAAAFRDNRTCNVIYGDFDLVGEDRRPWLVALSAFDHERLLEQGYAAHLFAVRRDMATAILAAGADDLYQALLGAVGVDPDEDKIVHLPGSLGAIPQVELASAQSLIARASCQHLSARGITADAIPERCGVLPAVRIRRALPRSTVTLIIPTRNRGDLLRRCVESVRRGLERVGGDILVIDNDSSDETTLAYLSEIESSSVQVLRIPGPFNYARLNNRAAELARGDLICLLNNDIEALDDDWLVEMASRLADPEVGAVGPLLTFPTGLIQHGGVVLGSAFRAEHAFYGRLTGDPGYADLLCVAHEASAVTGACLLTRRSLYMELDGMDEVRFPVTFNDVDLCLRIRQRGLRIVFTPHARLVHLGSASRGTDAAPPLARRFEHEVRTLRARWEDYLLADPYYSPLLSLDPIPFSALAWPPRSLEPRVNLRPRSSDCPAGF